MNSNEKLNTEPSEAETIKSISDTFRAQFSQDAYTILETKNCMYIFKKEDVPETELAPTNQENFPSIILNHPAVATLSLSPERNHKLIMQTGNDETVTKTLVEELQKNFAVEANDQQVLIKIAA